MDWTKIKMSELMRSKNLRMDPKYWLKKKATSHKPQASSCKRHETDTIKK
jgi:hypothetical protein